ncbi:MAG TPA: ATPase, partial [Actinoplanes sp.]|nr:ATPase [Actinoplanes sp.]
RDLTTRPAAVFRRDGDLWHLGYGDRVVRLPDAKGLHDLAALLAVPNQPVHVRRLLGMPLAGADPVLDTRARAEYRTRLADLSEQIDDAVAANDRDRAAVATAERDFIVAELTAATGLAHRSRRLGDDTERARKTVTARIRYAIGRIRRVHPALAEHLDRSVHTGVECAYQPDAPPAWRL